MSSNDECNCECLNANTYTMAGFSFNSHKLSWCINKEYLIMIGHE